MAKFNIEVELDWMEEDSYSIDEELKEKIVEGVEDALLQKATHEAVKMVDTKIAEKVKEAEETIINLSKMYALKRLTIFRFLKNQVVGVIRSHIIHCLNMWGCNLKVSLKRKDMIKMENTKIGAMMLIQQQSYLQQNI